MSKKKELLVIGAAAASCAAAAAGYSLLKNEDKPIEPKKLIETAKDTVLDKEVQNARAAFEYDEEGGDIIGGEKASIYRGPSDGANIQQWRDTATINQKSGAPSDREEGETGSGEKSGAPSNKVDTKPNLTRSRTQDALFRLGR